MHKLYERQVEELLSKMTLEEKIGQLNQPETPMPERLDEFKQLVREGRVGSILMSVGATAGNDSQGSIDIAFYNELQRIAVEESPNGIPILFGRDVIHGHRTVFPIPLAMTASFNMELIKDCYKDIATEASNESVHWTFTPMLDLSRDPRWGRIIEGTGEDPFLGASVAQAIVKGLQGDKLSDKESMLACAKHFVGYGASEGGRDYHRTEITDYSLYNYYLPAFRGAIKAGAKTVMSSFNDISGQPVTSSKFYLTEVLRDKLGFEGFVVSDYDAVKQLKKQGVSETDADSSAMAINAGLDMNMHDSCYLNELEKLVENGRVSIETVDNAVRRILHVKFEKGLFDEPYCKPREYNRKLHLENARKIAAESMVLLKNNNNLLPLNKASNIALIGPFATERRSLLGSWTIDGKAEETENLLNAMKEVTTGTVNSASEFGLSWDSTLAICSRSDVVVLALGESWTATGESRAVSNISIPEEQISLIKKVKATGKKVVGILFCGRPIAMQGIAEDLDAVIYAWHSGSETSRAVCDILFGDVAPSGRLPVTIPRMATHIPLYYNVTSSSRPVNCYYGENAGNCYVDSLPTPYYPFGYGLSYTEFSISEPCLDTDSISLKDLENGQKIKVSAKVSNVGDYDSKTVIQLYIHDPVAAMMRPIRELKAFNKFGLKKGETKEIIFELGAEELGYYDNKGNYVIEKGAIEIYIGENCLTENKAVIKIC